MSMNLSWYARMKEWEYLLTVHLEGKRHIDIICKIYVLSYSYINPFIAIRTS